MSDETYCYPPDFTTLRNRFGIRDAAGLDQVEREFVTTRMRQRLPAGEFDLAHLRALHRHLFQDVYDWAGEVRTVEIAMILMSLRDHLMEEQLCEEFCKAYTERFNELRIQHNAALAGHRAECAKLERERQKIVDSICRGVPPELVRERAVVVQRRREELQHLLDTIEEAPVFFHPNMASRYHKEIRNLLASLSDDHARAEAGMILRSLIERIVLTPKDGGKSLSVDLIGDLAGILSIATKRDKLTVQRELSKLQPVNGTDTPDGDGQAVDSAEDPSFRAVVAGNRLGRQSKKAPETADLRVSEAFLALVAGAGFEPAAFRL